LSSGHRDRRYLDPDDRIVCAGLLDPVGENGIVRGSEPDIPEIGLDIIAEINVLSGVCAGSVPDLEPDLVVGEEGGRTRDGMEFAVGPAVKERRGRSHGDIVGLPGGIRPECIGGSERDGIGSGSSVCVNGVLDGGVCGIVTEVPLPGRGRIRGEVGELDGEGELTRKRGGREENRGWNGIGTFCSPCNNRWFVCRKLSDPNPVYFKITRIISVPANVRYPVFAIEDPWFLVKMTVSEPVRTDHV